ncbi:MAG TPA: RagB/SusD family nutrient uptake outer membrane protein [Mucilaginibacter sp.]|nr:RagB/SusD family nutrient uptake outer membrane protein [Mucilaginibacter sp.]
MKKLYSIFLAAGVTGLLFSSCKKVLDKQDLQHSTAAQVYNDSTTAVLSLNYLYAANQPGWYGNGSYSFIGSTGPGNLTEENQSDNAVVKGTVTQESVGDIGTTNSNNSNYGRIRNLNQFIVDVNAGTMDKGIKKRFVAQALFWRAFRYFELVKIYGGVPLVLKPLPAVGEAAKQEALLPRSSTSATFGQIVADLDTAINYLPVRWSASDYGRITKGAAQAYLGRVLLTWASPQFNPGNDQSRWQAAYDASTQAIATLSANGWGLYPKWDYTMWTTEGPTNPEAVMVTEYNTFSDETGMSNESYTNSTLPKYIGTSGGSNQPTWDIVQAFPMADGKMPGTSTEYPYDPQTFYKNRDPRFYQTIAYNGCAWPVPGNPNFRLWTYYYYSKANGSATKSTEQSASNTGFYCRKAVDPSISVDNLQYGGTDWQEIRYAEVLLNQAEAATELGHLGQGEEAYTNLIAIRKRAGIEAGTDGLYGLQANMDHDQMISAIMYEREIEFAFEGKRYWDLRRRKLLESTFNGKQRTGLTILLNNNGSATDYIAQTRDAMATTSLDSLYHNYFTLSSKPLDKYQLNIQPADYFFGIPTNTLNNDPNIQQNNTWGGSFDPLK